jgi:hypothetical protein
MDGVAGKAAKDMQREHCDLERRREKNTCLEALGIFKISSGTTHRSLAF